MNIEKNTEKFTENFTEKIQKIFSVNFFVFFCGFLSMDIAIIESGYEKSKKLISTGSWRRPSKFPTHVFWIG